MQYKFAKTKKDEFVNKLTTSMLIANGKVAYKYDYIKIFGIVMPSDLQR